MLALLTLALSAAILALATLAHSYLVSQSEGM